MRDVEPGRHLGVLFPDASVAQRTAWSDTAAENELAKTARLRDFFQTTTAWTATDPAWATSWSSRAGPSSGTWR